MIDDIYDIWEPSWWESPWLWIMVISCVTMVAMLWLLYKRYGKTRAVQTLSPWESMHKELQLLLTTDTARQKDIYSCITQIIKKFLATTYGKDFSYHTDDELIDYLEQHCSDELIIHELIAALRRCSLAKFAGETIMNEQREVDNDLMRRLYEKYPLDTSGKLRDTK